jgi:hypothetical protein
MIVWLASYPRSGNTLLRTLLNQCFGVSTYNDEITQDVQSSWKTKGIGDCILPTSWNDFYAMEVQNQQSLHLVKTHKQPRDDQPAIYVYRDGRMAKQSFVELHRTQIKLPIKKTLLDLVLGDDYYGHWSSHYHVWTNRTGPTMLIRFEELVQASPSLITKIGEFLNIKPLSVDWKNPLSRLHEQDPDFFRTGKIEWEPTEVWTPEIDRIFNYLHGELMVKLGYSTQAAVDIAIAGLTKAQRDILDVTNRFSERCVTLQFHCDERLRVIESLSKA